MCVATTVEVHLWTDERTELFASNVRRAHIEFYANMVGIEAKNNQERQFLRLGFTIGGLIMKETMEKKKKKKTNGTFPAARRFLCQIRFILLFKPSQRERQ